MIGFKQQKILYAIGVAVVFVLLAVTGFVSPLAAAVGRLLAPVQKRVFEAWLAVRLSRHDRDTVTVEHARLVDDVAAALERERAAASCLKENAALKALLDYRKTYRSPLIAAQVIGFVNAERTHIMLDRGSESGIRAGDPVIAGEGIMAGRVIEARLNRSVAALLSDPSTSVAVTFPDHPNTEAILASSGLGLRLDLVPVDAPLSPRDLVVTSGIDTRIPRNLVIGRVQDVEVRHESPWLKASVEAAVSPADLSFVAVLLNDRE